MDPAPRYHAAACTRSRPPTFGSTSAKSTVFGERAIEVNVRAGVGNIELTENEWRTARSIQDSLNARPCA
jgi:hypothetical protein